MDPGADMLLKSMENIEAEMVQYVKDNAPRLTGRILVYETSRDSLDLFDRFYLNPGGMIEQEIYKNVAKVATTESSVDKFAEEYKQKALKQAVRKLGEELDRQQPKQNNPVSPQKSVKVSI